MAISNLTPVEPWPSRKLPQDKFDASVKTAMDQMSVMVGELNGSFIPAANETAVAINTLNPDLPAILDAPNQAAAASASAEAAAGSASEAARSVTVAAQEADRAKDEADRAKVEADRAEAITGVGPATVEKLGLIKPDGTTTQTTADGTLSVTTFEGAAVGLVPAATPEDAKKVLLGNGTWGNMEEDAIAMTISEDLILTADSPRTLVLTASTSGLSVYLPNPDTLNRGTTFHIWVRSLEDIQLKDFSGNVVKSYPFLSLSSAYVLQLIDEKIGLWAIAEYKSGSMSDALAHGLNISDIIIFNSSLDTSHYLSVTALSETKAVVCYVDSSSSNTYALVLSISGMTISVGDSFEISSSSQNCIITTLSETKALCVYKNGAACIFSISGTTISKGSEFRFYSSKITTFNVTALSETKAVVCYRSSGYYCFALVLSISGTTISKGSEFKFYEFSSSTNIYDMSVSALSETKVVACFRASTSSSGGLRAIVLSISGTTISKGSLISLGTSYATDSSVIALSETKAVVCYYDSNTKCNNAIALSISGTTISEGNTLTFNSQASSSICVGTFLSSKKVIVCYNDGNNSDFGTVGILDISETTVSIEETSYVIDYDSIYKLSIAKFPSPSNKCIITFSNKNSNTVGKTCVISIS